MLVVSSKHSTYVNKILCMLIVSILHLEILIILREICFEKKLQLTIYKKARCLFLWVKNNLVSSNAHRNIVFAHGCLLLIYGRVIKFFVNTLKNSLDLFNNCDYKTKHSNIDYISIVSPIIILMKIQKNFTKF